jgi:hypothetical protein
MKKIFTIIAVVAAAAALTTCGKEDDEVSYLTSVENIKNHIKGEWELSGDTCFNQSRCAHWRLTYSFLDSTYTFCDIITTTEAATITWVDTVAFEKGKYDIVFLEYGLFPQSYYLYVNADDYNYERRIITLTNKKLVFDDESECYYRIK